MLRKSSYTAIWIFTIIGLTYISFGYIKNNSQQIENGFTWCGIAAILGVVFWLSKRKQ